MTFLKTLTLFVLVGMLSSCAKQNYHVFGNNNLPEESQLKSFSFASQKLNQEWDSSQKAMYREMQRRNYFYDSENPEVLVFLQEFPEGVRFISGNEYTANDGKEYLEPTKIKMKGETLFIQLVETQQYQTVWRGFSYTTSGALFTGSRPILTRAILSQ
jgi:hypothetical protein